MARAMGRRKRILTRRIRWLIFREQVAERIDRGRWWLVCLVRGHDPMGKFDLRSGKLCRRCGKFLPDAS